MYLDYFHIQLVFDLVMDQWKMKYIIIIIIVLLVSVIGLIRIRIKWAWYMACMTENQKDKNHLEDLGTDKRINIKMDFKEIGWDRADWIETSSEFL
jgi:hypothetical protein